MHPVEKPLPYVISITSLCEYTNASSTSSDATFTIVVGKDSDGRIKKAFQVHRTVLYYHSAYFRDRLSSPVFVEDPLALQDVHVGTFEMFLDWAYDRPLTDAVKAELTVQDIHALYVFAEQYSIIVMQNWAVDLFFLHTADATKYPVHLSGHIDALSSPGSPLRMLYVDMLLETWESKDWKKEMALFPPALLADILDAGVEKGLVPGLGFTLKDLGFEAWYECKKQGLCSTCHRHHVMSDP
jgi:hypothetical protein